MNKRHDDPLDRSIRSALGDIIADGPTPSRLPVSPYEQRRTPAPVRSRRPMLVAAAVVAVAGVAGTVAIANRSSGPTTVAAADSVADSTPNQEGVIATTLEPAPTTISEETADTFAYPETVDSDWRADLLYPDGASVRNAIAQYLNPGGSATVVSPSGAIYGVLHRTEVVELNGADRQIGEMSYTFGNEDGTAVFNATNACARTTVQRHLGKVEPFNDTDTALLKGLTFSAGELQLALPKGWVGLGAPNTTGGDVFQLSYSATANGQTTEAMLFQLLGEGSLGGLLSQFPMRSASAVEWNDAAGNPTRKGWLLEDGEGHIALAWQDARGAALLRVSASSNGDGKPALFALANALTTGHDEAWAKALWGDVVQPTGEVGRDATVNVDTGPNVTDPGSVPVSTVQMNVTSSSVVTPTSSPGWCDSVTMTIKS
jgi:hypothetical protein